MDRFVMIIILFFIIIILFILINSMSRVIASNGIKPIVLLLDLDRTMIGNISPQSEEHYILNSINIELQSLDKKKLRMTNINDELKNINKKYLDKFLKLTKNYNNLEVFVYTASDDKWAKYVIPKLEKIVDFKFNKPLLTRNNIIKKNNQFKKSLRLVKSQIFKSLKRKYGLKNENELKYIMLFDDIKNNLIEKKYQILSPIYNKINQIDYLRNIPKHVIKTYYPVIENILNIKHSSTLEGFYSKYYKFLNIRYTYAENNNKKFDNDKYWKKVGLILKNNLDNSNLSFKNLLVLLKN